MLFRTNSPWWLPGTLLILFGVIIVLFPQLLAWMVATAVIVVGAGWLSVAYTARKMRERTRDNVYIYDRGRYW